MRYSKIYKLKDLFVEVDRLKKEGVTVGYIIGVFDIIHEGHVNFLRFAKSKCDNLVVGVNNDSSVKASKGKERPINSLTVRAKVLSEFESVNFVFSMAYDKKYGTKKAQEYEFELVKKIKPHFIFSNPNADSGWKEKKRQADLLGATFMRYDIPRSNSTTRILNLLKET